MRRSHVDADNKRFSVKFGHSKEGGWVSAISDRLQRKCDVMNRGFSGYNSRWCRMILTQVFKKENVQNTAALVIFLGANDSNAPPCEQHVPCDEYKDNLLHMVQYLVDIGVEKSKIILVSPPPCDEVAWKTTLAAKGPASQYPCYQDNKYKQQYTVACRGVASHMGCVFVDSYMSFMQQKDWKQMLNDGLHLSEKGSDFLSQLLWPHIDTLTQNLSINFPLWNEIDSKHPEKSLISNE